MYFQRSSGKISNNPQLERARAREIYTTYCFDQDKKAVMKLIKGSSKWHTDDSVERIFTYFKELLNGPEE